MTGAGVAAAPASAPTGAISRATVASSPALAAASISAPEARNPARRRRCATADLVSSMLTGTASRVGVKRRIRTGSGPLRWMIAPYGSRLHSGLMSPRSPDPQPRPKHAQSAATPGHELHDTGVTATKPDAHRRF